MMKKIALATLLTGAMLASTSASAAFIFGNFSIGNADANNSPPSGGYVETDFGSATYLTFTPPGTGVNENMVSTTGASVSGNYATPGLGLDLTAQTGFIQDISASTSFPLTPFFTLGTDIVFDLDTFILQPVGSDFVVGTGFGTIYVTGFDPTPAQISFSTQQAGTNTQNTWSASISSKGLAPVAPEIDALAGTGALTLLGGALALAGERRRRKV